MLVTVSADQLASAQQGERRPVPVVVHIQNLIVVSQLGTAYALWSKDGAFASRRRGTALRSPPLLAGLPRELLVYPQIEQCKAQTQRWPSWAIKAFTARRVAMKVAHPLIAIAQVTAIKREREQLRESRRRSYDELARILNTFDTSFPNAIPNDSDDFDERVHDYVALCKHIDERELPEAYERMMRLVTEQAPDAILTLHRVAEQETRRISDQVDRVNTGLGAVEFNRGTRLTLRATPRQLKAVAELTEIVRSISRRIAEVGLGDKQRSSTSTPTSCGYATGWRPQRRRPRRGRATR
jgi:hypothetical protein